MSSLIRDQLKGVLVKAALKEIEKNDNITFKQLCTNISDGELLPIHVEDLLREAGFKFTKTMKITETFEIHGCKGCPRLSTGRTYGNDGRDGTEVFICLNGVYGKYDTFNCWTGLSNIPRITPQNCPYNK